MRTEDLRAELIKQFGSISRSTLSDCLKELTADVEQTTVGREETVG